MTDIVERLRVVAWLPTEPELAIEAADEIERLRGIEQFAAETSRHERDGLRAEIERLKNLVTTYTEDAAMWAEIEARLRAEIERLRAMILDACAAFEHYLPEHAFFYRTRALESKP